MEWIVIISCSYSHTYGGMFYCAVNKNLEPAYGQVSEDACEKWAKDYLTTKYHIHHGQYEWGYRCEERKILAPYEPKKLRSQ